MTFPTMRIPESPLFCSLPLIAPTTALSALEHRTLVPNTTVLGTPLDRLGANATQDTADLTACRKNARLAMMCLRDMVVPRGALAVGVELVTTAQACASAILGSMATVASP